VVGGEDWVTPLCDGVRALVGLDTVGALEWRPDGGVAVPGRVFADCSPQPRTAAEIVVIRNAVAQHPGYGVRGLLADRPCFRISDVVRMPQFWDTEIFDVMHGRAGGRYPAAVNLGNPGCGGLFLGLHRGDCDFTDREMEMLAELREPLASALAFRFALDLAVARLDDGTPHSSAVRLTSREAEVVALVAAGWTNVRIGRQLRIAERTVRKHLDAVREKTHTVNRTEAASWWAREQSRSSLH